jgi:hypothetical protein
MQIIRFPTAFCCFRCSQPLPVSLSSLISGGLLYRSAQPLLFFFCNFQPFLQKCHLFIKCYSPDGCLLASLTPDVIGVFELLHTDLETEGRNSHRKIRYWTAEKCLTAFRETPIGSKVRCEKCSVHQPLSDTGRSFFGGKRI